MAGKGKQPMAARLLIWLLVAAVLPVRAQPNRYEEYDVKAAFLYNFAKFVHWPASAFEGQRSPIVFGVLGENPFQGKIRSLLEGRTINRRPLAFRHFESLSDLRDTACHLLFVSRSEARQTEAIIKALTGRHVVTVSDIEEFAEDGGMIRFFVNSKGKVRFEINLSTAEREGLTISSKLLSLARLVPAPSDAVP